MLGKVLDTKVEVLLFQFLMKRKCDPLMFLSAYESIQACQMMEELLGQVKASF